VTLLALIAVAGTGGVAAMLIGRARRGVGTSLGVIAALVVLVLAIAMPAEDSVQIGGSGLLLTDLVRGIAVVWSVSVMLLALLELGTGTSTVTGPALLALAVAVTALAATDPFTSFAALGAGSLAAIIVPGAGAGPSGAVPSVRLATLARGSFAVLGATVIAIVVVAWGASAIGPIGADPFALAGEGMRTALGLGLLTMVAAVAMRSGLIPLHVWAARFMEGVTPLAVPAAFAWGSAAFMLVALDWGQVTIGESVAGDGIEHIVIIGFATVSIAFGGLAALIHDDVEHVLGYSILQDAGIATLAFATLNTDAVAAAKTWLVASAAAKTALAAWAAVARTVFLEHRLAELGGWARRGPILGLAMAITWLAALGLPGTALFDARTTLVLGAIPGLGGIVVLVLAMTSIGYLGRIAVIGLFTPSGAVVLVPPDALRVPGARARGWSRASIGELARSLPSGVREYRLVLMSVGVLLLSVVAIALSIFGQLG
jgi:formate hydrogenlyase subunit 3/multisubunit Na+/H+ antiporter MnhD subunit